MDFLGERFWHENKSDIESKLQQNFRGAEIICQEGKVLFQRATGYAGLANGITEKDDNPDGK